MLCLILFIAIFVPLRIAFLDLNPTPLRIIEACIDIFFIVDIGLQFVTDYYDENSKVKDLKKIAVNYLKNAFFFDLIASIPFSIIEMTGEDDLQAQEWFKLVKLSRFYKFARVLKIFKILKLIRQSAFLNSRLM
jgi:hypothetical protein